MAKVNCWNHSDAIFENNIEITVTYFSLESFYLHEDPMIDSTSTLLLFLHNILMTFSMTYLFYIRIKPSKILLS